MSASHPTAQRAPAEIAAPTLADEPLRGILLVAAAMALFAVSDAVSKHLSAALPATEIAWLRWVGFAAIMAPFVLRAPRRILRSRAPWLQVLRTLGLLGSALFFIAGLRYLPLASASAIAFAAPLMVTALSIPLLGEKVGARRWAAVAVGLVGVLVVIRPGSGTFGPAALLPLLSAVSWAFGMIVTRKLGGLDAAPTTMAYSALVGLAVLTLLVPVGWTTPTLPQIGLAAGMALASTAAQFLVVTAYRLGRASVLAPVSYSQLVWSGLLGFLVFGNVPDAWTLLGAAIIIASGLYTAHRERIAYRTRRAETG
ncbi:DMT family transporter [Enterovirga aerilata]|uniref:DMT family transporter n=1 Tax=Enterovirga aerilata TaxID=2730920 RepID=UPI003211F6EB